MRWFRRLFWRFFLLIIGENVRYNKIVNVNLKPKSEYWIKTTTGKLIRFAKNSTTYYRNSKSSITDRLAFKEASVGLLSDAYREDLDKHLIKLVSNPLKNLVKLFYGKDFIFRFYSGGTTGQPLTIYKNKNSFFTDALLFIRGWKIMGYSLGDKVLVFYDSYYDYDLSWINNLSFLSGIKLFFFDSLSEDVIKSFVKEINLFKPDYIITFPSYINDAANVIRRKKLSLNYFPKGIEISGETLFEHQRKNSELVFKTKLYDSYGSMEFGMVAHECNFHNGMHIYEDIVLVKTVKNCLVFTRYDSFDMPIINYKIGDMGKIIYERCKCGINGLKIKHIHGRIDDYILLPNKKRYYPTFFRQVLDSCNLEDNNVILESNMIQSSIRNLVVNVVLSDDNYKEKVRVCLLKNFNKRLPAINMKVKFPKRIKKRRKFRFIERKI
ncbi:MAG: AMP-binding protein [Nanoarchaeota archaeon]